MKSVAVAALMVGVSACSEEQTKAEKPVAAAEQSAGIVSFEKFELGNGLSVVFHIDRSDPVVAVALTSHVGSSREIEGRTGFAHLFEHLLFLESENLGKGGLDKMSARIGGSGANGSTSRDRTNYFQTVPKDSLEKMIWAEADKLGWFINTVTEDVLAKEKQVVKNEKRQSVDNRPYGHVGYVIDKALFTGDHPYNWQVIGSLDDLQNATLQDVKDFFRRWYVPNNVTLTIAGDFDPADAKALVEKYFGEIKRGGDIPKRAKRPGVLAETVKFSFEDNFARLPELRLTWPTVPIYDKDQYALDVLTAYLSEGKNAPFNQVIVDDKKLASGVFFFSQNSELAGSSSLLVRAFPGTKLDDVQAAFGEAFAKFEETGIPEKDLARIKIGQEVAFYGQIGSVLGKAFQLAQYDIFAGDPGFIDQDIKNIQAVTAADVKRVYETYFKNQNYIATSFVPKGAGDLALAGSVPADVVEEKIVQGAEEAIDASAVATYERTPSTFDRTTEPAYGEAPVAPVPVVWQSTLSNGLRVLGMENSELPLVQFDLSLEGGMLADDIGKVGVANLLGDMMNRGTKNKSTAELEAAIEALGATITVNAGRETFSITGSTLARNYAATMALVEEMLLEPRWDESEFELAKLSAVNALKGQLANPNAIAAVEYNKIFYGEDHILSRNILGTEETIAAITLADLQAFHAANISPSVAALHIVGDVTEADAVATLTSLAGHWENKPVEMATYATPTAPSASKVYFYDVPGSKQSIFRFGYALPSVPHEDHYAIIVANYILGGGGFASRLTQELREGKGYTYGIRSNVFGNKDVGQFLLTSGVRSNVTLEASALVKSILADYSATFTADDLGVTKGFLTKSRARASETLGRKLNILQQMSQYGLKANFMQDEDAVVQAMTQEKLQALAAKYIRPDQMIYLVVGDAATQKDRLKDLGYGDPISLN
ncbi:MAG: peptidase M16 [Kordiimonadales bacterium]|nr:MAG: peptidase M16 [Kordiimonadales bacterium]